MASFSLQGDFPAAQHEEWLDQVERVLKGRSAETLNTRRLDGITIAPVYGARSAHPAEPVFSRPAPWTIVQRADDPDAARGNAQILKDLEGGAGGLALVFAGSGSARGAGLAPDADSLAQLLSGVHPEMLHMRVEGGFEVLDLLNGLTGAGARKSDISWCPDPLTPIAGLPSQGGLIADGRVWHEAGASDVQELAFTLAQALELLKALEAADTSLSDGAGRTEFLLSADTDIIGCIAKMRAMRLLWARLIEAAGVAPVRARIHAETSWRMMTARDVHSNMLRTGAAALAAAAGGADSITVLAFTAALGLPDSFARRVARNSQIILQDESGMALVNDPAAGAGAVEDLTRQIAAKAWAVFQDLQASGGLAAALASGSIEAQIEDHATGLMNDITIRRTGITGISEFPDLTETMPDTLPFTPSPAAASPLPRRRLAAPFEALRERAGSLSANGKAPRIFMANLGEGFAPRAMWTANLLAAGGFAAEGAKGFATPEDATRAFTASGLNSACICGDDNTYAAMAAPAAAALKAAGAKHVCLAGRPSEDSGADQLIHQGCDVIKVLETLLDVEDA